MNKKYVAYVGSYTFHGKSKGITVFDVDTQIGRFHKRKEIEVNNSSYLTVSHNNKFLYSIVDEGVASFEILKNGDLKHLNTASIKGMRGCFVTTDMEDKYLVTAGYHDGKMTVLRLNEDGSVGEITEEVFDRGVGSVAERNFRPHISCVQFTKDNNYLCMVDLGIDQVKVYRFDSSDGSVRLVDIIHCELNSAPRHLRFSSDGRFLYLISELKNYISVYSYEYDETQPRFELLQKISTVGKKCDTLSAACALRFSPDEKHVFCTNAGDNSVGIFKRDEQSGLLTQQAVLPVSGDYPKDMAIFPDEKHIVSINQDSNTLTYFHLDYDKKLIIMNGLAEKIDNGNCCVIAEV